MFLLFYLEWILLGIYVLGHNSYGNIFDVFHGTSKDFMPRYIEAQKSVPIEKIRKYSISARRFAQAYLMDGVTGDNVNKVYMALKKRQKAHRGAVELDPEPKVRRPLVKPFLQPQIPVVVPSSQDPIVISIDELDLESDGFDTDSEMEQDSEESISDDDAEIIVEE